MPMVSGQGSMGGMCQAGLARRQTTGVLWKSCAGELAALTGWKEDCHVLGHQPASEWPLREEKEQFLLWIQHTTSVAP